MAHRDAVILRGARTPAGTSGGAPQGLSAVGLAVAGVPPERVGTGPVPASRQALAGLGVRDRDLVEVNDAFAAPWLAVEREPGRRQARDGLAWPCIGGDQGIAMAVERV